eukprot:Blabericola_migrator_1__661@NODE_1164_length_5232_cov_13_200774_g794_i0_p6_GENE_NODE_1164_length_5232_cov_13_200774_g794_i0NODE_1164_length_5232_cov_13_200774_g794_i0_p6_ORF_typecomplete_len132_score7_06_NODE_1164_length_5232_cov_13_200774_g794_i023422737
MVVEAMEHLLRAPSVGDIRPKRSAATLLPSHSLRTVKRRIMVPENHVLATCLAAGVKPTSYIKQIRTTSIGEDTVTLQAVAGRYHQWRPATRPFSIVGMNHSTFSLLPGTRLLYLLRMHKRFRAAPCQGIT